MTDTGRIVAVTGASSGIGLAAARLFRDRGDKVYCLSRTDPKEPGITFIHTDVTDEASVNAAFGAIGKAEGHIDVLLSNAGIGVSGAAECTTMQDAKRQLDVNFFGLHACVRAAVPLMRAHGGTILATSSVAAVFAIPFQAFYSASKFAVNGLTLSLARELAKHKIRVNAVAPGVTHTDMVDALPDSVIKPLIESIPLGRMGEPEDIANAYLFLASDMADYISGAVLPVDGLSRP